MKRSLPEGPAEEAKPDVDNTGVPRSHVHWAHNGHKITPTRTGKHLSGERNEHQHHHHSHDQNS